MAKRFELASGYVACWAPYGPSPKTAQDILEHLAHRERFEQTWSTS